MSPPHEWAFLRSGAVWQHFTCGRCGVHGVTEDVRTMPVSDREFRLWRDGNYGAMPPVPECDFAVVAGILSE